MVFWQQTPAQATDKTFPLLTVLGCCFLYLVGIKCRDHLRPCSVSQSPLGEARQIGWDVLVHPRGLFWGARVTSQAPTRDLRCSFLSPSSGNPQL